MSKIQKINPPAAGQQSSSKPKPRGRFLRIGILAVVAMFACLAVVISFKRSVSRSAPRGGASQQPVAALSVTPPVAAGPTDIFEDVTEKAGIRFVNQFCDSRIANIIESNGAGGCWLDYDGDGLMDFYVVNSGPLDGVTHHAPGTVRRPNALYRNRGDGTFEDMTKRQDWKAPGTAPPP